MNQFQVQTLAEPDRVTVQITGDVDMACVEMLAEAFGAALATGRLIVVDCARITFLDSTGLRALLEARDLAHLGHTGFRLSSVPEAVRRVLELSGTASLFDVDATVRNGARREVAGSRASAAVAFAQPSADYRPTPADSARGWPRD